MSLTTRLLAAMVCVRVCAVVLVLAATNDAACAGESGIGAKIEKVGKKVGAVTTKVVGKTSKALKHAGKKTAQALDKAARKTGGAVDKATKKIQN